MLSCTLLFSFNLICNWVEMNKPLYLLLSFISTSDNSLIPIWCVFTSQQWWFRNNPRNHFTDSFFTVIERITLIYADNSLFFFALGQQQSPSILWLLLEDRFFMNSFLLWFDYRLDGVGASRKVGGRNTSGWSLYRGFAAKWRTPFWGV